MEWYLFCETVTKYSLGCRPPIKSILYSSQSFGEVSAVMNNKLRDHNVRFVQHVTDRCCFAFVCEDTTPASDTGNEDTVVYYYLRPQHAPLFGHWILRTLSVPFENTFPAGRYTHTCVNIQGTVLAALQLASKIEVEFMLNKLKYVFSNATVNIANNVLSIVLLDPEYPAVCSELFASRQLELSLKAAPIAGESDITRDNDDVDVDPGTGDGTLLKEREIP